MTEETLVVCGADIVELTPTCDLRLVEVNHINPLTGDRYPPVLQQKWAAVSRGRDGVTHGEFRWRNIPLLVGEEARAALTRP